MAMTSEPSDFQTLSCPSLTNNNNNKSLRQFEPSSTCVYSTYNRTFNLPLSEASPMHKRSSKLYTCGSNTPPNTNDYSSIHWQDNRLKYQDPLPFAEKTNSAKIRKSIISLPIRPPPAQLSSSGSHLHNINNEKPSSLSESPSLISMYKDADRSSPLTIQRLSKEDITHGEKKPALTRAWDSTTTVFDSYAHPYGSNDKSPANTEWSGQQSIHIVEKKRFRRNRCGVRRCWKAIKESLSKQIDPKVFLEMIDVRQIFWPFGIWKYTVLLGVAVIIAGIVLSEHYTKWIEKSMAITRSNMLPILVLVLALEPIMIWIVLLVVRIPRLDPEYSLHCTDAEANSGIFNETKNAASFNESTKSITEKVGIECAVERTGELNVSAKERKPTEGASPDVKDLDHRTALVIPCHNSDRDAMRKVLELAYPHFRPQDVCIVDNGRTKYPPDDFRGWIRTQHPDIVYIWSPIGSKNCAQLVGALACRNYDSIMTVDDDVSIPRNFRAPTDKIDDVTKGVAFPLRAIDASGKSPLFLVAWQDCEYKMSGLSKMAESSLCGVLYPHGAGWFCERDTLIDLISNYHSLDFIAEDVNTGLSMQKMKKRIAMDFRVVLETEVPTTIFGPGLNWWQQRKNSWEMGRHGRLLGFASRLFLSLNGQNTFKGILTQKFVHAYAIATLIVDWVRVPVLVTMAGDSSFWRQALLLTLVSMIPLLVFKYVHTRRRSDLQPRFWGCVTYPVYKWLYAVVSIFGAIRSVIWYFGGHKRAQNVRTMIQNGDERVFWLDPRFLANPGFLADEGGALLAGLTDDANRKCERASEECSNSVGIGKVF